MSFATFAKNVGKMLFGYVGGFLVLFAGIFAHARGNELGMVVAVAGFILILFGVYVEREM